MDKIFVSDFIIEVEIGAFQSEHGCTQRVKFNVSLDIERLDTSLDDDVDKVLSYEIITDAINLELSNQRFSLLETLAEKVADRCLQESRVSRAEVKIEKLDRIAGSLGVYISRSRADCEPNKVVDSEVIDGTGIVLASFSGATINPSEMKAWVSTLLDSEKQVTILIEPPVHNFKETMNDFAIEQVALLGMEQDAWRVLLMDERLAIVSSKLELSAIIKSNKVTLFCPSHFAKKSLSTVPNLINNYDKFLEWFAKELGLKELYLIGREKNEFRANIGKLDIRFFKSNDWNCF